MLYSGRYKDLLCFANFFKECTIFFNKINFGSRILYSIIIQKKFKLKISSHSLIDHIEYAFQCYQLFREFFKLNSFKPTVLKLFT